MTLQSFWRDLPRPLRIVITRLPLIVPQMFGVMLVTFLLVRLLPGDPTLLMLGNTATPESIAALREKLGLDRSVWEQFVAYVGNVLQGDLGVSLFTSNPVTVDLMERAPATLELITYAMILTVIVGHVLICMPYAIAILTTAFSSLDKSLEEAAYDLGETRWSAFRLITLPLVMPGIISSLLISFTISLDEFIIAFFLAGNQPTLPTYIFSQLRFPKQIPMIMALGTVLVALSILLLALGEYFRRRGVARTGRTDTGGFI